MLVVDELDAAANLATALLLAGGDVDERPRAGGVGPARVVELAVDHDRGRRLPLGHPQDGHGAGRRRDGSLNDQPCHLRTLAGLGAATDFQALVVTKKPANDADRVRAHRRRHPKRQLVHVHLAFVPRAGRQQRLAERRLAQRADAVQVQNALARFVEHVREEPEALLDRSLLAPVERELDAAARLQPARRRQLCAEQLDGAVEFDAQLDRHVGGRRRELEPCRLRRRLLGARAQRHGYEEQSGETRRWAVTDTKPLGASHDYCAGAARRGLADTGRRLTAPGLRLSSLARARCAPGVAPVSSEAISAPCLLSAGPLSTLR